MAAPLGLWKSPFFVAYVCSGLVPTARGREVLRESLQDLEVSGTGDGWANTGLSKQEDGSRCPTLYARPGAGVPALPPPPLHSFPGPHAHLWPPGCRPRCRLHPGHFSPGLQPRSSGPTLSPFCRRAVPGSSEAGPASPPPGHVPLRTNPLCTTPLRAGGARTAGPRGSKGWMNE